MLKCTQNEEREIPFYTSWLVILFRFSVWFMRRWWSFRLLGSHHMGILFLIFCFSISRIASNGGVLIGLVETLRVIKNLSFFRIDGFLVAPPTTLVRV